MKINLKIKIWQDGNILLSMLSCFNVSLYWTVVINMRWIEVPNSYPYVHLSSSSIRSPYESQTYLLNLKWEYTVSAFKTFCWLPLALRIKKEHFSRSTRPCMLHCWLSPQTLSLTIFPSWTLLQLFSLAFLPTPWKHQVRFYLMAFAPAVPSAWNAFPILLMARATLSWRS